MQKSLKRIFLKPSSTVAFHLPSNSLLLSPFIFQSRALSSLLVCMLFLLFILFLHCICITKKDLTKLPVVVHKKFYRLHPFSCIGYFEHSSWFIRIYQRINNIYCLSHWSYIKIGVFSIHLIREKLMRPLKNKW